MNFGEDTFVTDLLGTIGVIAYIVCAVLLYRSGNINMGLIVYIIGAVILAIVACIPFLPAITIAFVVLKIMGRLLLGWPWIIAAIILDLLFDALTAHII